MEGWKSGIGEGSEGEILGREDEGERAREREKAKDEGGGGAGGGMSSHLMKPCLFLR